MPRYRKSKFSYRKKSGVYATTAGFIPSGSGSTRKSVLAAAEVMAAAVRASGGKIARRIPPATEVVPFQEQEAMVVVDGHKAPNAAPFEFGERHPMNIHPDVWCKMPRRPFMNRAATNPAAIEAAGKIYGDIEMAMLAEEFGFNE